jgi:hypothetical protein
MWLLVVLVVDRHTHPHPGCYSLFIIKEVRLRGAWVPTQREEKSIMTEKEVEKPEQARAQFFMYGNVLIHY